MWSLRQAWRGRAESISSHSAKRQGILLPSGLRRLNGVENT